MQNRFGILSWVSCSLLSAMCLLCLPAVAVAQAQDRAFLRVEAGGHNGQVRAVLFTPDGQRLISVGYDKVVRVWDAHEGSAGQLRTFRYDIGEGNIGEMTAAAIYPGADRHELAIGERFSDGKGPGNDVLIIDYESGKIVKRLPADGVVSTLKYSNGDGALLAAGTGWGTLHVWSGAAKTSLWKLARIGHKEEGKAGDYVEGLAFSPDNTQIAVACKEGEKRGYVQYCALTSRKLGKTEKWDFPIKSIDWAKNTQTLAWGDQQGVVSFLQPKQAGAVSLPNQGGSVTCLAFSADGKQMLDGSGVKADEAHNVQVWSVEDLTDVRRVTTFREHRSSVLAVALSPDGAKAASADSGGRIYLWNARTGARLTAFEGEGDPLEWVRWSPDGKTLAWGGQKQDGNPPEGGDPKREKRYSFDFSQLMPALDVKPTADWPQYQTRQGDIRLTATPDKKTLIIWKTEQGKEREFNRIAFDAIQCFTFTPDGRVVVGADGQLFLFDTQAKGKADHLCMLEGHEGTVFAASVSPGTPNMPGMPRYLATASADRTVRLWNLDEAAWTQTLHGKVAAPVLSLFMDDGGRWIAWTEAGYYYASAGGEKMIGWHLNRGADQPAEFVTSEAFYRKFRRADVIQKVVGLGGLSKAIAQVNLDIVQNKANVQQLNPQADVAAELKTAPRLEVAQVGSAQLDAGQALWQTTESKVNLSLRILNTPPGELANVDIRVQQLHGASEQKTKDLELGKQAVKPDMRVLPLSLIPGENTIVVTARRKAGDAAYGPPLTVRIVYNPARELNTLPSLHVLSIGVQQFQDRDIAGQGALQFPVSDAVDFAAALRKQEGLAYKKVSVSTLKDQEATPDVIKQKLSDIKKEAAPGDLVIVFVSSHGLREVEDVNKPGQPKLYFALSQTELKRPQFFATALSCDTLINGLDDLDPSVRVLIVLDACHAGPLVDPHAYNDGVTALNRQFYVLASCGAAQTSLEDPGLMHGLFTGLLLEALGPNPQHFGSVFQPNKPIPLFQLEFYVKQRMYERLAELKSAHEQYPTFSGPDGGYFPVVQIR